jgi:hypothetical protein
VPVCDAKCLDAATNYEQAGCYGAAWLLLVTHDRTLPSNSILLCEPCSILFAFLFSLFQFALSVAAHAFAPATALAAKQLLLISVAALLGRMGLRDRSLWAASLSCISSSSVCSAYVCSCVFEAFKLLPRGALVVHRGVLDNHGG